ncbi:MAG TPA: ATP-binding protein [Stellaceae bacterium]|nr:ATP-binding protein [Stellaceae bacterium]
MTAIAGPTIAKNRAQRGPKNRSMALSVKFALAFVGLVSFVLIVNGAVNMWLSYTEAKTAAVRVQEEKAVAAAARISQFIEEIEQQIGWTTHAQWSSGTLDQRRYDFVRLLRQVPAITELTQLDGDGKEQLKVSRLAMDVVGSGTDYSNDPRFVRAVADKVWFGPVYFRKESEPYMTLSVAHVGRKAGVTVAEVNLKFIWDVITSMQVGKAGYAYVVDQRGRLIAHPDLSLVLRDTDLSHLPQVATALAEHESRPQGPIDVEDATGPQGGTVLSAHAPIPRLNWLVFVELPLREALAPVYASLMQTGALLGLGLLLAAIVGTVLARRMTVPIRELQAGAEKLGAGELDHRIEIRTGDEIQTLADRFNTMAGQLQESLETLEAKVEARTHDLQEALTYQTATGDVLRIVASSPDNLQPVFDAMLEKATALCNGKFGNLLLYDGNSFHAVADRNLPPAYAQALHAGPLIPGRNSALARLAQAKGPVHVKDARSDLAYAEGDPLRIVTVELGGVRSMVAVPLLKKDELIGAFMIYRDEVGGFAENQIALVTTFADQAVIAIENARLLGELRSRTADLARSVEDLRALSVVGQSVTSSLDLKTVLETIVTRAAELAGADGASIFRYRRSDHRFRLWHSAGLDPAFEAKLRELAVFEERTELGHAARDNTPVELSDLASMPSLPIRDVALAAGYHSALIVPLKRGERVFGALVVQRRVAGRFGGNTLDILQTFASQSVLAIQNARLFREIEDKSRQLEVASQHKSQFLANMSHELRTPLNAVLGYAELLMDGIYGELPEKARGVLERMQSNGKHLLGLINDVLDLSKIEAGQLTLAIEDYSMSSVVHSVVAATESLAKNKGLMLNSSVPSGLPMGRGDERRLTQVVLNLVGNAIKFTDQGSVEIAVQKVDQCFDLAVKDTGPGISKADQGRIFEEFQQVDNSNTRKKGGTGLGLAISKRIVEMHGGTINVESEPGKGSTFHIIVPIQAERAKEVA